MSRGSAELLEESGGNLSPSESMTSIPTCMPFSWFGDRDKEPSSTSSSLPYAATETSSEQSQDRKNKVSAHTHTHSANSIKRQNEKALII